jgi:hypothetical protein
LVRDNRDIFLGQVARRRSIKDTYDWICGIAQEQNREGGLDRIRFVFCIIIPIHGEAFVLDIETIASKDEAHIDISEIRHVRQFLEF